MDPSPPFHVAWGKSQPKATFWKELSNESADLAVLKIEPENDEAFPTLPMAAMPPRLLRDRGVVCAGFQEAKRHVDPVELYGSTYRHNPVRPIRLDDGGIQNLLIIDPESRNVEQGASGGPVVDVESGHVIGVITAHQRGWKRGRVEPSGRILSGGAIIFDEVYFPEGYAVPLYEVFASWPEFGKWCRIVGDVRTPVSSTPGTIGPYCVIREIGRGGFGTVYEARSASGDVVALKRFEPLAFRADEQAEARSRFLRGAGIMQRLHHPNIARVVDINEDEAYLTMDLANRASLDAFLRAAHKAGRTISFHTRVLWAIQLTDAVQYAHDQGVLHRDISPANVLVREDASGNLFVLLSDFDLAFQRGRTQLSGREWNWRLYLPRPLRDELDRLERTGVQQSSTLSMLRPGIDADLFSLAMVILYLFTEYEPGPEGVRAEIDRLCIVGRSEKWCSSAKLEHLARTLERVLVEEPQSRFTSAGAIRQELAFLLPPRLVDADAGMRLIPGGPFFMGAADFPGTDEYPRHRVRVSDFFLDECPVTNLEFRRFLDDEENAEWQPGGELARELADDRYLEHWRKRFPEGLGNHPVVSVSWHAAAAYALWAGKRLPTEAEWEYAARAGTDGPYWWGDKPSTARMNYFGSRTGLTPIRTFPANPWGLFDILGNVAEWCADWYGVQWYDLSSDTDPTGPPRGTERVLRGGGYDTPSRMATCSARAKAYPRECRPNLGFRCARDMADRQTGS